MPTPSDKLTEHLLAQANTTSKMQLLAASAVDNPARPWDPRDDAGYEHAEHDDDDEDIAELVAGWHESVKALAGSLVPAQAPVTAELAGLVLLRGMQSPSGDWQWQLVEGIYRERHRDYLERLKGEREAAHPEPFWRFEIATVSIPGVPA